MNEKNKMLIIVGLFIFVILLLVGVSLNKKNNIRDVYDNFENVINDEKRSLIYIGASHCGYCNLLNPSIEEMKERYDLDYFYIDTDKLNGKYLDKIIKRLDIESFGTPYLAVVENGKKIKEQVGFLDYDKLFEFLQSNEIISKNAKLALNYIKYEEYDSILKSNERSVVVVGQSTCGHCVNAKLTLNKIATEKNIKINYLNVNYLNKDENTKFTNSLDFLSKSWGTPLMLILQDGKLIDHLEGDASMEKYIQFLEKNEVL